MILWLLVDSRFWINNSSGVGFNKLPFHYRYDGNLPLQMRIASGKMFRNINYSVVLLSSTTTYILDNLAEKVGWVAGLYGYIHRKGVFTFLVKGKKDNNKKMH